MHDALLLELLVFVRAGGESHRYLAHTTIVLHT